MGGGGGYRVGVSFDLRQDEARTYRRGSRRRGRLGSAIAVAVTVGYAAAAGRLPSSGAVIAALGVVLVTLAGLPVGLAGHAAARRHGLSVQSRAGWLADWAKAMALGAALAALAGAFVVAAQQRWPVGWVVAAWSGQLTLAAILTVVLPVTILPLFLRSAPLGDGPLRAMTEDLLRTCGLDVRDIRLLLLSAKTTASNAMVVGAGPTRRILLGDTLVGAADDEERLAETRAVLAHELGHTAHRDLARLFGVGACTSAATWAGAALLFAALPEFLAHGGAGDPASLPALALAYGVASFAVAFADAAYSRGREREADRYACRMAGGDAFARALEHLVATNLAELDPPVMERLRSGHPPAGSRIAAARAVKESVP